MTHARILLPVLLLLAASASAQKAPAGKPAAGKAPSKADFPAPIVEIARNLPAASLRNNVFLLASPAMQGRGVATAGDTMAARHVERWFRREGLQPGTANGFYQAIEITRIRAREAFAIGGQSFADTAGWNLFPGNLTLDWKSVQVVFPGNDTTVGFMNRLSGQDLSGKLVMIPAALFRGGNFKAIDSVEAIMKGRGALGVVWSDPFVYRVIERRNRFYHLPRYELPVYLQASENSVLPELALTPDLLKAVVAGTDGISIDASGLPSGPRATEPAIFSAPVSLKIGMTRTIEKAPNVIGIFPGTDKNAAAIVVTAHRDHDGINNGVLYPGAVDNASGTSAVLQLATMMKEAAGKGYRPKRTIVFASVTGEERGLLGSAWYAEHPVIPLEKTWANMNLDMLGRVDTFYKNRRADSNYVYYLVEDSAGRGLMGKVNAANNVFKALHLDDRYTRPPYYNRMLRSSDQYPLFVKGVPFVYYDTGFCEDYHQPTDTPDKINYDLMRRQVQLAFLTLWKMAE